MDRDRVCERDREIQPSTNTPTNTNSSEAIERKEAYRSFSAAC